MTLFGLLCCFLCWAAGSLRIPQRWLPQNPILAAIAAEKAALEKELVSQMIGKSTAEASAAPTTPAAGK